MMDRGLGRGNGGAWVSEGVKEGLIRMQEKGRLRLGRG